MPEPTVVAADLFDPRSVTQTNALISLFHGYLIEEHDRTGRFGLGVPAAAWANTFLITVNGTIAGFCSADTARYAIELIYVSPEYRRRGVAQLVLTQLRASCPQPMRIKAPLSPACQALAAKLGLPVSSGTEEERHKAGRAEQGIRRAIEQHCRHPRAGNPGRPCPRCYRKVLRRGAAAAIKSYVSLANHHATA